MRLLTFDKVSGFILRQFPDNAQKPSYAILSHTWLADSEELTFGDVIGGKGTEKEGYQKLMFCAAQAREAGLEYFWIDTCCINKADNNELTTAINSMFRWYQNSTRCFVYLSDVSVYLQSRSGGGRFAHADWHSAFRNSRWFSRGWTLQELLAPRVVEFFSRDSVRLGDKVSLEDDIQSATGIQHQALRGSPLADFSVEEKLSWSTNRGTKLEEDRSYCLLGIFDVSLPLIYGEGLKNAERRLRKEIRDAMEDRDHDPRSNSSSQHVHHDSLRLTPRTPPPRRLLASPPSSVTAQHVALGDDSRGVKEVHVALLGSKNCNKTEFIRLLTGTKPEIDPYQFWASPQLPRIEAHQFMYNEHLKVHLLDVPGRFPKAGFKVPNFEALKTYLANHGDIQLGGVICLSNIARIPLIGRDNDSIFYRGSDSKYPSKLRDFEELCGPTCAPRIVLATDHWDAVDPMDAAEEEIRMIRGDGFWSLMYTLGSPVCRLSGSRYSALAALEWTLRSRKRVDQLSQRSLREPTP